jgi:putative glycosyltransferase
MAGREHLSAPAVDLSIVTSMYRSSSYLEEFYARCTAAARQLTDSYEFVFVNDGSPDDSLQVALQLRTRDARVRIVDLSRNFGHHKALMTGLARARGERVFLLDCDLEEDPAWLLTFDREMRAGGADVVYGVQLERKGGWFERVTGDLFFTVFNRLLTDPIPANVVTVRLMTSRYVQALVSHRDQEVCLAALWQVTGFDQRAIPVHKGHRGQSSYSVRRRISVLVNALTSFSNRPLIYIFYLGSAVMLLSMAAGAFLIYESLRGYFGVPGWASIMVSIWFLGGLTIFCVGVVGVYVAKVFTETKDRPYTVVRHEYGDGSIEQQP